MKQISIQETKVGCLYQMEYGEYKPIIMVLENNIYTKHNMLFGTVSIYVLKNKETGTYGSGQFEIPGGRWAGYPQWKLYEI